ncbi:MAG: hypothetical protein PVG54_13765, partial [Anaerolineae bacterium]
MEAQRAKEGRPGQGAIAKPDQNVESSSRRHARPDGGPGGKGPGASGKAGPGGGRGGPGGGKPGPSGPVWPVLRRLLGYMQPHALILAGVILAALATTAVELAPPWIIRLAVDRFILEGQTEQVWWAAGGLLALSLLQGGIDFLRLYVTAYTGQRIVFEIRNAIFHHLSR